MTNPKIIRSRRAPRPKCTVVPVDFSPRMRKAIYVMAARNGLTMEEQVLSLVRGQLGI